MSADTGAPHGDYVCSEPLCSFRWRLRDGYFELKGGIETYPPNIHQLLKPALICEHGYMYISRVGHPIPTSRTWRCAVKDCPNFLVD
jgi:hypothetical protein